MSYLLGYSPYKTNFYSQSPRIVWDADALAFIAATGITSGVEQVAINDLVLDLKFYNLWTKMFAIYPFVGGIANTHKYNLKDPQDLNSAYRLVFAGGWTHSSTGATPNGVNAYANTFLTPVTVLNYASLSYYSRTNTPENGTLDQNGCVLGVRSDNTTVNNALTLRVKSTPNNYTDFFYTRTGSNTNNLGRVTNPEGRGFFVGALDSTSSKIYINGVDVSTTSASYTRNTPNLPLYLGSINNKGIAAEYSLKECAFAHIGDTLTSVDIANLNTAVQAFQITLSRQV